LLPSKKKGPLHHHQQQQQDGVDSPYVTTTKKSSSNKADDVTLSLRTVDFLEDVDALQEEYPRNHHHASGDYEQPQPHSRASSSSSAAPAAVSFGVVEIRSYKQVLGDHPFCTNGCPIQLGWTYTEECVVGIDEYEQETTSSSSSSCWNSSRSRGQYVERLKLTAEERKQILLCGSSSSSSNNNTTASSSSVASSVGDRDNVANGTDENNVTTTTTTGNTPGSPLQLHNLERSLSRECRRLNRETRYRTHNSVYTKHVQREFFGTERKKTNKY
jgi:hypothetical protein